MTLMNCHPQQSGALRQRGAILPVTLFILVIVTLLVVSTVDTTSSGMKLALNQQAQIQTELAAEQAIEMLLGDGNWFSTNADGWKDLNEDGPDGVSGTADDDNNAGTTDTYTTTTANNFSIQVEKPNCFGSVPVSGYSAQATLVPETNYWEFQVTVSDQLTGARTIAHQGARIRQLSGSCDDLNS